MNFLKTYPNPEDSFLAFISYSHEVDKEIAKRLHHTIKTFAKPWYRFFGRKIYLDKLNLAANPDVWGEICKALENSKYLILFASPEAKESEGVIKELKYWIKIKEKEFQEKKVEVDVVKGTNLRAISNDYKIIIVLLGGNISYDSNRGDFDWEVTNSIPLCLKNKFVKEPLWIDLRRLYEKKTKINDIEFQSDIASIVATIENQSKDTIYGLEVSNQKKFRVILTLATLLFLILFLISSYLGIKSWKNNNASELANEANIVAKINPFKAISKAVQAVRIYPNREIFGIARNIYAENIFPDSIILNKKVKSIGIEKLYLQINYLDTTTELFDLKSLQKISVSKFRKNERESDINSSYKVVSYGEYGRKAALLTDNDSILTVFSRHEDLVLHVALSPTGSYVVTSSYDKTLKVWNLDGRNIYNLIGHSSKVDTFLLTSDSQKIVSLSRDSNEIFIWSLRGIPLKYIDFTPEDTSNLEVSEVYSIAISPNDSLIAVLRSLGNSGDSCSIELFDHEGDYLKTVTNLAYHDPYASNDLSFITNEEILYTQIDLKSIIHNITFNKKISINTAGEQIYYSTVAKDKRYLISANYDSIFIFDHIKSLQPIKKISFEELSDSLIFSFGSIVVSDAKIFIGCDDGIFIYNFINRNKRMIPLQDGNISSIDVYNQKLVAGGDRLHVINLASGKVEYEDDLHSSSTLSVKFSSSGKQFLSSGVYGSFKLFDSSDNYLYYGNLEKFPVVWLACFTNNSKKILIAGRNGFCIYSNIPVFEINS